MDSKNPNPGEDNPAKNVGGEDKAAQKAKNVDGEDNAAKNPEEGDDIGFDRNGNKMVLVVGNQERKLIRTDLLNPSVYVPLFKRKGVDDQPHVRLVKKIKEYPVFNPDDYLKLPVEGYGLHYPASNAAIWKCPWPLFKP